MISTDAVDTPASFSRLVSDGALLQLLTCFIVGSTRPDPYVVGPLIALYATRECDRRAMFLYLVVTGIAAVFELLYTLRGGPSGAWETLQTIVQLVPSRPIITTVRERGQIGDEWVRAGG